MKKILIVIVVMALFVNINFSQGYGDGVTANSRIVDIRLNGFEDASFWKASMPIEQGIITKRGRRGSPKEIDAEIPYRFDVKVFEEKVLKSIKDGANADFVKSLYEKKSDTYDISDEDGEGGLRRVTNEYYQLKEDGVTKEKKKRARDILDKDAKDQIPEIYARDKVLGLKIEFITRGYNWFSLKPIKPIVIEGRCLSLSVWVAGRSYKHTLKFLIKDFFGQDRILYGAKLNFTGWKEIVVYIPGNEIIKQWDHHYIDKEGIKFNGFLIECDPMESFGSYYIYFDELRAKTDLFNETTRDEDDMRDDW